LFNVIEFCAFSKTVDPKLIELEQVLFPTDKFEKTTLFGNKLPQITPSP
jgi:hypothetical protein